MHSKTSMFLVPALLVAGVATAQNVNEGGRKFTTELTGEAEVNATGAPNQGDLDGTGSASITVNPGQKRICYDIDVSGIATPMRGHIHRGVAGANGAIVVDLLRIGRGRSERLRRRSTAHLPRKSSSTPSASTSTSIMRNSPPGRCAGNCPNRPYDLSPARGLG